MYRTKARLLTSTPVPHHTLIHYPPFVSTLFFCVLIMTDPGKKLHGKSNLT